MNEKLRQLRPRPQSLDGELERAHLLAFSVPSVEDVRREVRKGVRGGVRGSETFENGCAPYQARQAVSTVFYSTPQPTAFGWRGARERVGKQP